MYIGHNRSYTQQEKGELVSLMMIRKLYMNNNEENSNIMICIRKTYRIDIILPIVLKEVHDQSISF